MIGAGFVLTRRSSALAQFCQLFSFHHQQTILQNCGFGLRMFCCKCATSIELHVTFYNSDLVTHHALKLRNLNLIDTIWTELPTCFRFPSILVLSQLTGQLTSRSVISSLPRMTWKMHFCVRRRGSALVLVPVQVIGEFPFKGVAPLQPLKYFTVVPVVLEQIYEPGAHLQFVLTST